MARGKILSNLLTQFLTESIVVYFNGLTTLVTMEDGSVVEHPMVADGVLWDFDEEYILLGDDRKIQFSLVNRDHIAKIDIVDNTMEIMTDPNKPNKSEMS